MSWKNKQQQQHLTNTICDSQFAIKLKILLWKLRFSRVLKNKMPVLILTKFLARMCGASKNINVITVKINLQFFNIVFYSSSLSSFVVETRLK